MMVVPGGYWTAGLELEPVRGAKGRYAPDPPRPLMNSPRLCVPPQGHCENSPRGFCAVEVPGAIVQLPRASLKFP